MTITITRLDYTKTIDALVTGACRHAAHAATPAQQNELYAIAADLNAVAKRIARSALASVLNAKLPPPGAPADDDPELANEPQMAMDSAEDKPAEDIPAAVLKVLNSPAPRQPVLKDQGKTYRRILDYIRNHPLSTKDDLANVFLLSPGTVDYHIKHMLRAGDIIQDHQRRGRAHRYRVADAVATATAAD